VLRAGLFAAQPVLATADALAARLPGSFTQEVPPGAVEPLDANTMAACLLELAGLRAAVHGDALIHSPRVELIHAIACGDAFVSRLEGEWWLSC